MKDTGILMKTPMVQAILNDTKTETRRTRELGEINANPNDWHGEIDITADGDVKAKFINRVSGELKPVKSHLNLYDSLYIKETFGYRDELSKKSLVIYKASEDDQNRKWQSSLFMPKKYARIWMEIESIGLERLKKITQEEAISEGIHKIETDSGYAYKDYEEEHGICFHPVNSFASLWNSINGANSFDINPWVWVIKYKVISKTGAEALKEYGSDNVYPQRILNLRKEVNNG